MRHRIYAAFFAAALFSAPLALAAHDEHEDKEEGAMHHEMMAAPDHDAKTKSGHDHNSHADDDKDEAQGATTTLEGEFVELGCYTIHQSEGPDHADCAEKCAAAGAPVALKEAKTGKLYLLITEGHFVNAALPALGKLGKKVRVEAKLLKNANLDMIVPVKVEVLAPKAKPAKKG